MPWAHASASVASRGPGVRDAERREQRVADELLQAAPVPEDLLLHPAVVVAQQRHHALGRHLLGQRGEADEVREEHADRLPPHAAKRLVALGEDVHDLGREVPREVPARALGLGPLGHERTGPSDEQGQPDADDEEHDDLVLVLELRHVVGGEVDSQARAHVRPGRVRDGPGRVEDGEEAEGPGAGAAQRGPQEEPRPERERHLHEQHEEVEERGEAQGHGQGQWGRRKGIRREEDGGEQQRVHQRERVGRPRRRGPTRVEPELREPGAEEERAGTEHPGVREPALRVRVREPRDDHENGGGPGAAGQHEPTALFGREGGAEAGPYIAIAPRGHRPAAP